MQKYLDYADYSKIPELDMSLIKTAKSSHFIWFYAVLFMHFSSRISRGNNGINIIDTVY